MALVITIAVLPDSAESDDSEMQCRIIAPDNDDIREATRRPCGGAEAGRAEVYPGSIARGKYVSQRSICTGVGDKQSGFAGAANGRRTAFPDQNFDSKLAAAHQRLAVPDEFAAETRSRSQR